MAYWKDQLDELRKKMLADQSNDKHNQGQNQNSPSRSQTQKRTITITKKPVAVIPGATVKPTASNQVDKPIPTIAPVSSGIKLNTQTCQEREINIGFDLGTAYTKLAYRIIGPELVGFVPLSQGGPEYEKTMIPSVVWIDKEQRLYCVNDTVPEGSTAIRFFKMHLAGTGIGPCLDQGFCTETPFYKLVTAYFIYRVLSYAKAAIHDEHARLIGPATISWSGNLGIPVGYLESSLEPGFLEVLRAGVTISNDVDALKNPTLKELDAKYSTAIARPDSESVNYHLTTELEASISGLTSDVATPDGMYGLFDIGGGTLDGAVFSYRREHGSPRINILTAMVAPIGFDVAVDSLTKLISHEDVRCALKSGSSTVRLNSTEVKKGIHVHVSSVVVIARRKSTVRWADIMKTFPIFLCGGGCHASWLRDTVIETWQAHQHGNCGIPQYQAQSLGIPSDLNHGCKEIKNWDRHLVAYGLSFPKGSLSDVIGFPRNNPVIEYEQFNYDNILDERLLENYGELL